MVRQITKFLKEVRIELSRVEWPKFDEFIGATLVTLLLVLFFTLFFFLIDGLVRAMIHQIL